MTTSNRALTMEDLIEAFAFDESNGRAARPGETTMAPASRRFREAQARAKEAVSAALAEAEKRGAVRVLREAGETMSWFGAQGNLVNPDTAWAGISACMRVLKEQADRIEAGE